jgi:hypothetical protein
MITRKQKLLIFMFNLIVPKYFKKGKAWYKCKLSGNHDTFRFGNGRFTDKDGNNLQCMKCVRNNIKNWNE